MRCYEKVDLSVCGLLVTTTLFLCPAIIFLTLAFQCHGWNINTVNEDKTSTDVSCRFIDHQTTVILFVFGFLFLFVGMMVCGFAFLVHHTNAEEKRMARSKT